ncbi:ABC transporter-like protein [Kalmanozyma brasiliensis GHG001]|uniref:ABC transporter domain-containing protein n=1 Tax=Kalmanozyma brasiliensis (strain GHG001) TaxID=1365824 RepID=V5GRY3_KALBG|nr:ABC transporter-like protein [Kalmanozyma brasiliensis GHG001]EST08682.1 ABC transporter-like protein [Kalmanozyma brasiliensis GHG001]
MSVSALSMYQSCPPGLTSANGTACNAATCNSTFVAPDARVPKPTSDRQCSSCDAGFGGVNCNVCQSAGSCQARKSSLGLNTPNALFGQNETLVCHKQPSAVHTTYIDCNVNQLTVNGVYPGEMRMTLSKTYKPDSFSETGLASWPQESNTALSQVWLNGVEQFYCQAAGCSAKNSSSTLSPQGDPVLGSSLWTCTSLQCYCIPGTAMCGAGSLDLSPVINKLNGTLTMPCDYVDPNNATATSHCAFRGELLNNFLGEGGLPLDNCQFGSCITQSDLDEFYATGAGDGDAQGSGSSLSKAVIAGLVILGVAVAALLALLLFGFWQQRKARRLPKCAGQGPVGLQWEHLNYTVPLKKRFGRRNKKVDNDDLDEALPSSSSHEGAVAHLDSPALDHHDLSVVRNSSGSIQPGCMVAVLGPSGAGKTSLVEILAGRHKIGRISGTIRSIEASLAPETGHPSRRTIDFIDQEDALPAFSTVREALQMAADLSLPDNVLRAEKREIVDTVIHQLGLERVANKRIGDASRRGLSGGERRRVSIGCALVSRPRLLIADEPLSGLDAFSASRVISAFRELAAGSQLGSTTVIVTVHQPSSEIFYTFDQVLLMSQWSVIYHGPPADSLAWCERQGEQCPRGHNVADHLLKIASHTDGSSCNSGGEKLHEKRSNLSTVGSPSGEGSNGLPAENPAIAAGPAWEKTVGGSSMSTFMTQLTVLSRRNFITARRDPAGALAHILGSAIIGLIVGGCFYQVSLTIAGFQNRVGSMYFLFILLSFSALSAATALTKSRSLMMRERANSLYGPTAWLVSYVAYDALLLRVIPALLLSTIMYWMVGMQSRADYFFEFILIAILFHLAMALYNMLLAALIEDLSISILFAGVFILFNIGFGGFLLNLNDLRGVFRWLQWVCPMKYALEAVASHELEGLQLIDQVGGVSISASVSVFSGNLFAFKPDAFYRDLLVLALGFVVGFFALLVGAVGWRMRERR